MPKNKNLFFQILQNLCRKDKLFLEIPNGESFSYNQMISISSQYANALTDFGVKENERVILQTEKAVQSIWLYLACLRIGAIFIPLNPAYTAAETIFFIQDADPSLFVYGKNPPEREIQCLLDNKGIEMVRLNGVEKSCLETLASKYSPTFKTCESNETSVAAILYTSGTTGRSKGAMITHKNLLSNAKALTSIWKFSSNDVLLHILPIYHTHGLFVALNTVLFSNSSILFLDKFRVKETANQLEKATVLMGVPTHYVRLLKEKILTKKLVSNMRLFISGSAPLSPRIHKQFYKATGHKILERYGMTETNMITSNPYDADRRAGTVGFPLPGVTIRITDIENKKLLTQGQVGNIEVKGPNVFKGYWRMPEKLKTEFRKDGYFITGDLGFIDRKGYLSISGRGKDLIISGGLNVYPAEVENVIDSIEGVSESCVIGLPHEDFGEAVTAIVVFEQAPTMDTAQLQNLIAQKLAGYKTPVKILFRKTLSKNQMGKIQKALLRKELRFLYSSKI